jgi:ribosomal protein S27AE
MATLENINNNILTKMDALKNILFIYSTYELDPVEISTVEAFIHDIDEFLQDYVVRVMPIVKEYLQLLPSSTDSIRRDLYKRFVMAFDSDNIMGNIKRIYQYCKKIEKKYEVSEPELAQYFKAYDYVNVDETYDDSNPDCCPKCKVHYDVDEKTSEYVCGRCGKTEKMYGVVFEDTQFFYQEGQRTKHGKYDPTKHCRFWVDRIQAKENVEIPVDIINKIKRCIRRDSLYIDSITCEDIRKYLKILKIPSYNNNVPLIRKLITGKEPPPLTDHELRLLFMHFGVAIQIFNKIKSSEKSNCPYHPFFIYKIIEQLLNKPTDTYRKKELLACIHLQSRETLVENDRLWFAICDHIPEFTKIATEPR